MRPIAKSRFICTECRHAGELRRVFASSRYLQQQQQQQNPSTSTADNNSRHDDSVNLSQEQQHQLDRDEEAAEQGALSRRLAAMTEEMLESSPRNASKTVEAAGFDEELKNRLLDRITSADFKSANAGAMSTLNMPSAAGRGTREQAAARAWDGNETLEDAALRMLDDAHKRIKTPAKIPSPVRTPKKVDAGRPGPDTAGAGQRLANARDRTSRYSYLKDESLSPEERNKMRQELKERFTAAARSSAPATLAGLASLADQRIDDAIARGQFKNLPRGKPIKRDFNMSSPFLDTTEYFMNKIMERQQIVPPWIEKQQELVAEAARFRGRLRNDWLRYAARSIASRGGNLESQVRRAEEFARAELAVNPRAPKRESVTSVDEQGHLSQITLQGELRAPAAEMSAASQASSTVTITSQPLEEPDASVSTTTVKTEPICLTESPSSSSPSFPSRLPSSSAAANETAASQTPPQSALGFTPFRDEPYLQTELPYLRAAVAELNALTRSYNLMAPNMARKPYFSLDRELLACYADVAPRVAGEIRARALRPADRGDGNQQGQGRARSVLEGIGGGPSARVHDDRRAAYGFREFWRDLFAS